MAAITWSTRVNVGLAGTTLTKNGGDPSSDDAYAISTETLAGDGSATVTLPSTAHAVVLGLSVNSGATSAVTLSHAINANGAGSAEIREAWTYQGELPFVANDEITISRTSGMVR